MLKKTSIEIKWIPNKINIIIYSYTKGFTNSFNNSVTVYHNIHINWIKIEKQSKQKYNVGV